jgi:predicted MFS family arabinose efflux permease
VIFPRGLRALNHDEFRRFFWPQLVAQTGSWMQTVAQSWLVLTLSIFAGAVADRFAKRRLLIATQTVYAGQATALGVLAWTGHAEYWHICVLGAIGGFTSAVDMPVRQSYMADIVGREDLVNAVALNSAAFNAARIVGPAIAGVMIGQLGVVPAFLINAAGFVVVIGSLVTMTIEGRPAARSLAGVFADIGEGLRYALATPRIRVILGLLLIVSLCVFNFSVYVPLLARDVLGLGPEGFGFLMAALGVGAVAGALTIGATARGPSVPRQFGVAALACGGLFTMSLVRHVPVATALLFVIGYFGIMLVASCNTALQLAAPDHLRGRVMSLYAFIWGGVFPVGSFCVGSISEAWGVPMAFRVMGSVALLSLGALGAWWRWR